MKKPPAYTLPAGVACLFLTFMVAHSAHTGPPKVSLAASQLTESSGICIGGTNTIWSHNDSGGKPVFYGFTPTGQLIAKMSVAGAEAVDWEDACSLQLDGVTYLAAADVGDNVAKRKQVEIYIVREPKLNGPKVGSQAPELSVPLAGQISVTFASGPVNCESVAYDPIRRVFLLPSKEAARCRLFEVDAKKIEGKMSVTATASQSLFLPLATGADISRDGKLLVICSYGPGCLLTRTDGGEKWDVNSPTIFKLPNRRQGEAICFSADSKQLLLTSEFAPTPLHTIDCPPVAKPTKTNPRQQLSQPEGATAGKTAIPIAADGQ